MDFVKCDIPTGTRASYRYGCNQELIKQFSNAGITCARITNTGLKTHRQKTSLTTRLNTCAKKMNMNHIVAFTYGEEVYFLNKLLKEGDATDGTAENT